MPSLALPHRLIWFAHCPKAGGTSVEQALVAAWGPAVGHLHWGWDLWWRRGGWRAPGPPSSPQHLTWADAEAVLRRRPDRVFALVRDPAARMASEYRWQRRGRRGTPAGRALARLPFPVWLALMLALAERDPYAFDNHLRPQSDFVPEHARVFRLEDGLADVARWLAHETGRALSLPHALKSEATRVRLTPACRTRIARAHGRDQARFGYPPGPLGPASPWLDLAARLAARPLAWLGRRGLL